MARVRSVITLSRHWASRLNVGIYVGKYNFESRNPRHFRDDPEGECRHNNLRAGRELESFQDVKECHAAEGCRNATSASEVG